MNIFSFTPREGNLTGCEMWHVQYWYLSLGGSISGMARQHDPIIFANVNYMKWHLTGESTALQLDHCPWHKKKSLNQFNEQYGSGFRKTCVFNYRCFTVSLPLPHPNIAYIVYHHLCTFHVCTMYVGIEVGCQIRVPMSEEMK